MSLSHGFKTLADVRNVNPVVFDQAILKAVFAAAEMVGQDIVIKALTGQKAFANPM